MPVLHRPAGCIRSEHAISRSLRVKDGTSPLSRYRPSDLHQVHYSKAFAVYDARSETLNKAYRMARHILLNGPSQHTVADFFCNRIVSKRS
jgi:hypothetical protein